MSQEEQRNQQRRVDLSFAGDSEESAVHPLSALEARSSASEAGAVEGNSVADTDEKLMLAYGSGDTAAFETLYRKYRPSLFRFFLAAVADENLANELYQETWTKVIRASAGYQPTAAFSTWLFTIARNKLRDHFRKYQPHLVEFDTVAELHETESRDGTATMAQTGNVELQPDELAILAQQTQTLQQALDKLPLNQKEVMLLRYVAGMTLAEIASSIDEKPETVKSRLRYATTKMKNDLKHSLAGFQRLA